MLRLHGKGVVLGYKVHMIGEPVLCICMLYGVYFIRQ